MQTNLALLHSNIKCRLLLFHRHSLNMLQTVIWYLAPGLKTILFQWYWEYIHSCRQLLCSSSVELAEKVHLRCYLSTTKHPNNTPLHHCCPTKEKKLALLLKRLYVFNANLKGMPWVSCLIPHLCYWLFSWTHSCPSYACFLIRNIFCCRDCLSANEESNIWKCNKWKGPLSNPMGWKGCDGV